MEQTIPLFTCKTLAPMLDFYQTLGFEIPYQQDEPYLYAALTRGAINLHFTNRGQSADALVFVPEVDSYHRTFADALRRRYGRVPTAASPRISRLRSGQTRFHLFDPGGNSLTFICQDEPDIDYDDYPENLSPLGHSLEKAIFLRDTYVDDPSAAKLLDRALTRYTSAEPLDRARALAARAELAVALGETDRAHSLRGELRGYPLAADLQLRFREELEAADKLERWITTGDEQA